MKYLLPWLIGGAIGGVVSSIAGYSALASRGQTIMVLLFSIVFGLALIGLVAMIQEARP